MGLEIREHRPGEGLSDFIRAAHVVFEGDPAFIPPLEMEIRDRLTPAKNPFFEHAEVVLFTAHRDGKLVGRCSAQIDHEHQRIYEDRVGFFGFFDTLDDQEVASALIDAASRWCKSRGMTRLRGPMSLSINEEAGLLIDGFEHPPVVMMPHSRPYQGALAEGAGLQKCKDLYAWRYVVGELPKRAERAWQAVQEMPEVSIRSLEKRHMHRELAIVQEIFNDAWSSNWGFVPWTAAELRKTAEDMKLILDEDIAFIAEINGQPVAMCVMLPNVNEAIRDAGGKLFPLGLLKLIWRLKVKKPKSARLVLLGIKKELRGVKQFGALSMAMYAEVAKRGEAKGYEWAELGWTLDDNAPVNLGIKAMGAKVYKTYRVYEKELA